jgi:hypothetical protein
MSCNWRLQLFIICLCQSSIILCWRNRTMHWIYCARFVRCVLVRSIVSSNFNSLTSICFIVFIFILLTIKYGVGGLAIFDTIQKGWESSDHNSMMLSNTNSSVTKSLAIEQNIASAKKKTSQVPERYPPMQHHDMAMSNVHRPIVASGSQGQIPEYYRPSGPYPKRLPVSS